MTVMSDNRPPFLIPCVAYQRCAESKEMHRLAAEIEISELAAAAGSLDNAFPDDAAHEEVYESPHSMASRTKLKIYSEVSTVLIGISPSQRAITAPLKTSSSSRMLPPPTPRGIITSPFALFSPPMPPTTPRLQPSPRRMPTCGADDHRRVHFAKAP